MGREREREREREKERGMNNLNTALLFSSNDKPLTFFLILLIPLSPATQPIARMAAASARRPIFMLSSISISSSKSVMMN